MKNKNDKQILNIFSDFKKLIDNKPPIDQMISDLQMMQFKIKPMGGNIFIFDLQDKRLIEVLWSLGKLDELYQKKYKKLSLKDKNIFFQIFDSFYQNLQEKLRTINLKKENHFNISSMVEMEIYQEKPIKN